MDKEKILERWSECIQIMFDDKRKDIDFLKDNSVQDQHDSLGESPPPPKKKKKSNEQ